METLLMFLGILLLVLLVGAVLAVLAFGFSYLLFRLFGRTSGLDRLAELYPATGPPEGELHRKQRVAVGAVYYRNSADVCICPEGLYLWVKPFLGSYQPALIPWSEFREPRGAMLRLQQAVRLTVGDPEVTTVVFTQGLFDKLRPYLSVAESVESARGERLPDD
jgi:hypothetical protein